MGENRRHVSLTFVPIQVEFRGSFNVWMLTQTLALSECQSIYVLMADYAALWAWKSTKHITNSRTWFHEKEVLKGDVSPIYGQVWIPTTLREPCLSTRWQHMLPFKNKSIKGRMREFIHGLCLHVHIPFVHLSRSQMGVFRAHFPLSKASWGVGEGNEASFELYLTQRTKERFRIRFVREAHKLRNTCWISLLKASFLPGENEIHTLRQTPKW